MVTFHYAMQWLENAAHRHQHIISALEAFGTVGATFVAVIGTLLALLNGRVRLTVTVGVERFRTHPATGAPIIAITITNIGSVPARFQMKFFSWKIPGHKTAWNMTPDGIGPGELVDGLNLPQVFPYVVNPSTSETIYFSSVTEFRILLADERIKTGLSQWAIDHMKPHLLR